MMMMVMMLMNVWWICGLGEPPRQCVRIVRGCGGGDDDGDMYGWCITQDSLTVA